MIFTYTQTPTVFGPGAVKTVGEKIKELGCRKILCVYGSGTRAAGIAGKVEDCLAQAGIDFHSFDQTSPDPTSDLIDQIAEMAKAEQADCIIGIGGGSNLDSAKAASIMMNLPGKMKDYLTVPPQYFQAHAHIVLISTTSGSGSEASNACVITHEDNGGKFPCLVDSTLAIVDPELSISLSPSATAMTGMDAFAHAVEAYLSQYTSPRAQMLAMAAIPNIIRFLPVACRDGSNIEARTGMAYASNWAGLAMVDAPPHLGHCIAEGFTQEKVLPHGLACAWATPEFLAFMAKISPEKVRRVGEAMGLCFGDINLPETVGEKVAERVRTLMKEIGIKTPAELELDRGKALVNPSILGAAERGCPVTVDSETALELMSHAYDNYK